MTDKKCIICNKDTTCKCGTCKSAAYCSFECQKLDIPLHKILCTKLVDFLKNNPRPADEYLSRYKLGILFPVDSKIAELIWVKNKILFEEVGKHWEVWPKLNKQNECLGHLLHGYQWTGGGNPISEHKWSGNVVVLRSRSYDKNDGDEDDGRSKVYEDITLADFRSALTYMGSRALLYEYEKENRFFIRDERKWAKGVKISCVGDMDVLGKAQYRDVMISWFHDIQMKP
ncbi:hypothetical protein BKA65DRAFT_574818 [Rhexocercosporidium sp. MPI-PUGE-AT-0058]|nr:hypothetical protein BKA65DRAFT_574818 [Rhexocercosporidium sp. MPI-PUGE-AT-0058]